jgi:hypothetical protein
MRKKIRISITLIIICLALAAKPIICYSSNDKAEIYEFKLQNDYNEKKLFDDLNSISNSINIYIKDDTLKRLFCNKIDNIKLNSRFIKKDNNYFTSTIFPIITLILGAVFSFMGQRYLEKIKTKKEKKENILKTITDFEYEFTMLRLKIDKYNNYIEKKLIIPENISEIQNCITEIINGLEYYKLTYVSLSIDPEFTSLLDYFKTFKEYEGVIEKFLKLYIIKYDRFLLDSDDSFKKINIAKFNSDLKKEYKN